MRIVGGKDYYDSASAYGIDPGIVFVRDNRVLTQRDMSGIGSWSGADVTLVEETEKPAKAGHYWRAPSVSTSQTGWPANRTLKDHDYVLTSRAVVFCGKLYRGVTIRVTKAGYGGSYAAGEEFHFWHAAKLIKWAEERGLRAEAAYRYNRDSDLEIQFATISLGEKYLSQLIEQGISIAWKKEREEHVNAAYNTEAYLSKDSGWRADTDGLKDIGFQSALDPVTAFQELAMWVGGTLSSRGPNTVEIVDDEVKLAKHGMDKTSFRRPKEKYR